MVEFYVSVLFLVVLGKCSMGKVPKGTLYCPLLKMPQNSRQLYSSLSALSSHGMGLWPWCISVSDMLLIYVEEVHCFIRLITSGCAALHPCGRNCVLWCLLNDSSYLSHISIIDLIRFRRLMINNESVFNNISCTHCPSRYLIY